MLAAHAAAAYGPEGLFGGRRNPDDTYALPTAIAPEAAPARGETVAQHARPDYDAAPVQLGSFNLFPRVETGTSYDSNIYATKDGRETDTIFDVSPSLNVASNWDRHALSLLTFGDIARYDHHTSENFSNGVALAQGRYDITDQTSLSLRGGVQRLTEPRYSPNDLGGSEPTNFYVYSGGGSFYRGAGLVTLKLDYDFRRLDYDNTPSTAGTLLTSINTRDEQQFASTVGYKLTQNLQPYVRVGYNTRHYDNQSTRQSTGYDAVAGATADLGGIVFLDAFGGWLSQDYSNFGNGATNDAAKFGGTLTWNVTGLTTLTLEAARTIEETPLNGFSNFLATGGSATLTHELRRNWLIEGDFSYTQERFQGFGSRTDNVISTGGGARWLINRNLYADLVYKWDKRDSTVDQSDYASHTITLHLGAQM